MESSIYILQPVLKQFEASNDGQKWNLWLSIGTTGHTFHFFDAVVSNRAFGRCGFKMAHCETNILPLCK